ncbi:MAG: bifunctional folylpolyglutamate synthase/dihydrofolate synthase [Chloroflexi bacterium]|nr:bifunctional folylpolyglutamate synthase/dihydrofolate synthase [Chloroflexota bacterium]
MASRLTHALDWLFGLGNLEAQPPSTWDVAHFTLARPAALLESIGSPQRTFKSVLIAGTKGKGSTSTLLASLLHAHGVHVGLYTSPHLLRYVERYQLDGLPVADEELAAAIERLRPAVASVEAAHPELGRLSTYEVATVAALDLFARRRVDWAVLEVGLGGRLDATNVVAPAVAAIVSISYDHVDVLGPTLADIAREKAGVARTGCDLLVGAVPTEAWTSIQAAAARYGASVKRVDREPALALCDVAARRFSRFPPDEADPVMIGFRLGGRAYRLRLGGREQAENARLALALAERVLPPDAFDPEAAVEALQRVSADADRFRWQARFDFASRPGVLLDGAHNGASMEALVRALGEHFPNLPIRVVLGIAADKDVHAVLAALRGVRELVAVQASHPRAMPAAELATCARSLGIRAREGWSVESAVSTTRWNGDATIPVVTGSFHVLAEALGSQV